MEEVGNRQKCWSWSSNNLANRCEESTHYKRPWWWERLKTGGEGDGRGWDGWMASPTQWTWVLTNSRSWWWTGKPVCSPWGRKESDMTEWLDSNNKMCLALSVVYLYWSMLLSWMERQAKNSERVTGRKARGLPMEEIGCKCQTFLTLLRAGGNKLVIFFFPFSVQI